MGNAGDAQLPVEWGSDKGIAWKTALPGEGASSPVTFGNRVFLTSYTGYFVPGEPDSDIGTLKRRLIAINIADGKVVWERALPAKQPDDRRIRDHGYAASTPAADSERVYAFFGKSGVFAFDHSGKQLWQADVGDQTNG